MAADLARTLAGGVLGGALTGLLVGGVLGRLAMRLLAITSPWYAQGQMTDDQALVGQITLTGTLGLALVTTVLGGVGGLVYLWVRRVLPASRQGRVLGFGLFTGAVGGALFVHDHPSFDFSILEPEWLAVALFVALPLLFGLVAAWSVETLDGPGGRLRRLPRWLVVLLAFPVAAPTVVITGPVVLAAFGVALSARLQALWQSRFVTLAGSALYVVLVAWGVYGLVADVLSIAADRASTAPLVL